VTPLDEDTKIHKLLNLIFSEIHLVKHPANRKPILLLKSAEGNDVEGGNDMPNEEQSLELEALDDISLEDVPGMTEDEQSVVSKALDVIKSLVGVRPAVDKKVTSVNKEGVDKEEDENGDEEESDDDFDKADSAESAAKEALTILEKYKDDKNVAKAIAALTKVAGTGETPEENSDENPFSPELDKAGENRDNSLVNIFNALIKVAKSNWDKLPEEVQAQVDALVKAMGESGTLSVENPEEKAVDKSNPKSEKEEKLEKSLSEQRVRLEKMEQQLAEAQKDKRLMELHPISKSVGEFSPEQLYQLEALNPDLFNDVVKHMENLQTRINTSEFFKEFGTATPIKKGSPTELLDQAAREYMKEHNEGDYATALSLVSALPEHRDHIPQLYREND